MPQTVHRKDLGHYYKGVQIHAGRGEHEFIADLCKSVLRPDARILEVGAGSGALAMRLKDQGFDVTATDLEPNQPWITALDLDDASSFRDIHGTFDLVLCVETLEHLENPRGALRSMRKLVSEGGQILVSTPNVTHPHSRLKTFLRGAPTAFGPDHYYSTGHITILPDWLLVEHVKQSGFGDVKTYRAAKTDFTGARRVFHEVEMVGLRLLGLRKNADRDAGTALIVTATAV